ncbi:hypothetical protein MRX96_000518 [Rhipicephalus microplus]
MLLVCRSSRYAVPVCPGATAHDCVWACPARRRRHLLSVSGVRCLFGGLFVCFSADIKDLFYDVVQQEVLLEVEEWIDKYESSRFMVKSGMAPGAFLT